MKHLFKMTAVIALLIMLPMMSAGQEKKKVLLVNSYHQGYLWSDGITEAVKKEIGDKADIKVFYMDTKLNQSEGFKKAAGLKAKMLIDTYKPDVVITSDDNAAKYVISVFYKNSPIPFVFCGINLDCSEYGFPWDNVTGMVEVADIKELVATMKTYAKGERIGYLSSDTETDKKQAEWMKKRYNLNLDCIYVKTFEEWKAGFKKLQESSDMFIQYSTAGIKDFNHDEAKKFALENAKVPVGSIMETEQDFSLVGYTVLGAEQGEWAAQTALKILGGKSPKDIPIAENTKSQIVINSPMAKKLGIKFPDDFVKKAKTIGE